MENSEDHGENKEHWVLDLCNVLRKYVLWFKFNLWFEFFQTSLNFSNLFDIILFKNPPKA